VKRQLRGPLCEFLWGFCTGCAGPHSGPRRAKRAKEMKRAKEILSPAKGSAAISRAEALAGALAVAVMLLVPAVRASAQAPRTIAGCPVDPVTFHTCALLKMKTFNPARTPDGRPDMQGYWERTFTSQDIEEHTSGFGIQAGPSLVIDPPDRKIPYQPWAQELRKNIVDRFISPLASCFPPGVPRQAYAPAAHQIIQAPGYVVHLLEYSHSYQIIPTTDAPHLSSAVRLWQGDSRGHWEGNTLVVDVTNSNGLTWFDNAGNFYSDALHVVERLTLIDADTIHYEARLEDPKVYTRPWTMVSAMTRNKEPGFEIWEQACHEGNQAVEGSLSIGMKRYPGVAPPR
jgi:hypothetical protein